MLTLVFCRWWNYRWSFLKMCFYCSLFSHFYIISMGYISIKRKRKKEKKKNLGWLFPFCYQLLFLNHNFPLPLTLPLSPARSEGWFDGLHALSVAWRRSRVCKALQKREQEWNRTGNRQIPQELSESTWVREPLTVNPAGASETSTRHVRAAQTLSAWLGVKSHHTWIPVCKKPAGKPNKQE